MGSRRKARELALQLLYQLEITGEEIEKALPLFWEEHSAGRDVRDYASALARGTLGAAREIDPLLGRYARNWVLDRMAAVDRNVLRLAVYEMLLWRQTPPVVVINEAVDIAKKYSTPGSGAFVNGILDRIRREEMGDETDLAHA